MSYLVIKIGDDKHIKILSAPQKYYFHFDNNRKYICTKTLTLPEYQLSGDAIPYDSPIAYCPLCPPKKNGCVLTDYMQKISRPRYAVVAVDLDNVPEVNLNKCFLEGKIPEKASILEIGKSDLEFLVGSYSLTKCDAEDIDAPAFKVSRPKPAPVAGARISNNIWSVSKVDVRQRMSIDTEHLLRRYKPNLAEVYNPYNRPVMAAWSSTLLKPTKQQVADALGDRFDIDSSLILKMINNIKYAEEYLVDNTPV